MGTTYKRFDFPVCMNCSHRFRYCEMVFHSKYGYRNFICQKCSEKESELMNEPLCGGCKHFNGRTLCDMRRFTKGKYDLAICPNFRRSDMPNIKITAEVDGKQVPLENISTETFEAIKALKKPFICPKGWVIEFEDWDDDCGWRIMKDKVEYLHKDFTVKIGTGWDNHQFGEAPGYWSTKQEAEAALTTYLEKSKEIPVPVARLATNNLPDDRLILRIDDNFRIFIVEHRDISEIAINVETGEIMHWGNMRGIYKGVRSL